MSTTLYGNNATPDQVRKHIVELLTGNPQKNVPPMSVTDVAKRLGISRETVYQYRKKAIELKEVELNDDGSIKVNQHLEELKDFIAFTDAHPITSDPIVDGWISRCRVMGHGSNGVKQLKKHVQYIQKLCNVLRIKPIQLTIDLSTAEKYAQAYYDKLANGEIERNITHTKSSVASAFYPMRMAIRHLMQFNQRNPITIPRGSGGILSGKTIGHGDNADVELTDDQIHAAEKYIVDNYGLDSDIYRVFFVGIESCARKEALLDMKLEWTEDTEEENGATFTTFYMQVVESKTEHIGGGKFDKFVERAKTQESLRLAKAKGYTHLWNSKEMSKDKAYRILTQQLKEVYKAVGCTKPYFFEHAMHSLRHIGAHYWLRKTDYNYGFVAVIGGWHTIDELKKSYGKMPPHVIKKLMKKNRLGLDSL